MNMPSSLSQGIRLWLVVAGIFCLGLVVRLLLLSTTPSSRVPGLEPINIAISVVRNGTYADPYGGPTGPSAHCMPLHPLLAALLIRIFGFGLAGSRALSYAASVAASLAYALLPILAKRCSLDLRVGIGAGVFGAALPINFWCQTSGVFEAPYTFLAFTIWACAVAEHWQNGKFTARGGVTCGVLGALSTMLSPLAIPILGFWFICAFLWFSKLRISVLRYFAIALLIVCVALAPWAMRNKSSLGTLILTRSNFGLEFQVSNNGIATSDAELNVRNPAWARLHPNTSPEEREKVRLMGEVTYNKAKRDEALQWIKSNPKRFLELTAGRIALFWFPRMLHLPQTLIQSCITILAIAGAIKLWRDQPTIALFFGSACVAYSLAYIVIEVSPRYRFPIEGFLLLLGSYYVCSKLAARAVPTAVHQKARVPLAH
jgi:hypothetical protein